MSLLRLKVERPASLDLLARTLPATLLTVLALRQPYLVWQQHLSPWKGGGFGMFAVIDAPGTRVMRAYLLTPAGAVPVRARDLRALARRHDVAVASPTPERLAAVATALAGRPWTLDTAGAAAASPDRARTANATRLAPTAVRVEVWRRRWTPAARRLSLEVIAARTVARATRP